MPKSTIWFLLVIAALATWLLALGALLARPAAALDEATGLYSAQGEQNPYRWTSNRARIPIHGRSGPTSVTLTLGPARWPGRAAPTATLASDSGVLATFTAPDHLRRYHIVLPASSTFLAIEAPVEQPPASDRRWLGVTLYDLTATASGLPLREVGLALALALASLLLALGIAWSARRGYRIAAALFLLALALRLVALTVAPPGFRPDEVVSLVDAWNLSQTGRDHLGHLLPLGAMEAFGDWIAPLLAYLEVPAAALLGPQALAGRLVTAVCGALAAPLGYRLARQIGLIAPAAICTGLAAALSPWQIFMSRIALPGGLVPTCWTLCLLAGILLIQRGGRREAIWLALAAGIALYSYPTMKLAVPLLAALAVALALLRHGWGALRRWLPAAPLGALLWLPFAYVTLFNPASRTRLDQAALKAGTWSEWLAAWWDGYGVYFQPGFYYATADGSSIRGVPGHGAELLATAPLVILGLLTLIWILIADCRPVLSAVEGLQIADWRARETQSTIYNLQSAMEWWFIAGAILIAPLAASLTQPSPHNYRAATIAPLYALLAGLGVAAAWRALELIRGARLRRAAQWAGAALLTAALAWQLAAWFRDYTQEYPPQQARDNQDGLIDAMTRAIGYAPSFDEVWISYDDINEPYIYLLAARPMPPAQAQREIAVTRRSGHFNDITAIGPYRFVDMAAVPERLPTLEAIPDRFGGPAFVLQQWQQDGRRILILRRMG